nr:MAG TPA: hypothetical protein [Caudoviricetes sp.]
MNCAPVHYVSQLSLMWFLANHFIIFSDLTPLFSATYRITSLSYRSTCYQFELLSSSSQ